MQLSESKLFTIEALNRIEGFVWIDDMNYACMFNNGRFVWLFEQAPFVKNQAFDVSSWWVSKKNTSVEHPDWRNSLITKAEFDSVDGWVRSWVASVPESIPACGIEVECGIFGRKWRYHKPTKETTMPATKPEIHAIYESYKQQCETTADAQRALDASKEAEDALLEQIKQWNLQYGFDVRLLDESEEKPDQQDGEPVITDWRDLRVGDVVEITGSSNPEWIALKGNHLFVSSVAKNGVFLSIDKRAKWFLSDGCKFKFIRRPQ